MSLPIILIADDDSEDQLIIREAIESRNAHVDLAFANDGKHALELLGSYVESDVVPSLVVLDLNMPKMNGTQTLQAIKSNEKMKRIPVVIYTTSINRAEREKCIALGAMDYLVKPISIRQSIETADIFLELSKANSKA